MTSRNQAARIANPLRARAADTIRYHIKQGHLIRPEACDKCGSTKNKPIGVPADLTRPREDITWLCTPCHKVAIPRKPIIQPPRLQNLRKLPPYEELKRLVLPPSHGGEGLTYAEVGKRYKCSRTVVNRTLRDRARRAGDPWPLPGISSVEKQARSVRLRRKLPPYGVLKSMLIGPHAMTYAEVGAKYGLSDQSVHNTLKADAIAAGEWPLPINVQQKKLRGIRKAIEENRHTVLAIGIFGLVEEQCEKEGVTIHDWSVKHGIYPQYFYAVRNKLRRDPLARIQKKMAVRVLEALEEPVPGHVRAGLNGRSSGRKRTRTRSINQEVAVTDNGEKLDIEKQDEEAASGDQTPLQMRDVNEDDLPDPADEGDGYVSSGIDPAHVQQKETEDNVPKGTLPGV